MSGQPELQLQPHLGECMSREIANLRFLIADKEPFHRDLLAATLAQVGAQHVQEVGNGLAALQALQDPHYPIDISIIDLDLPGMDGMELIRHISKDGQQHAVIVVSGLDASLLFSVETMSKAYGVDLLGSVSKPVTPEILVEKITRFELIRKSSPAYSATPRFAFDDIRAAIDADEFLPYFQPKLDLATRKVVGVEAFARWQHPKLGLIFPGSFIPIMEKHEAMSMLTSSIVTKSIAASRMWRSRGFQLTVSINISPSVLAMHDFAEQIIFYTNEHDVAPSSLIFEITEAATVTDGPHFLENLARLRMHGFGISVDDYGTGKSSLQQLMRIPFSELKIDRTFVSGAARNHALELVLSASLAVCHQLDRKSVAVGVETKEDWDFLQKLGCTYAQGFYIAKPMDAAALPVWLQEWKQFF
jgi:EAL domain-containing protein (putative c-di-GMP-specific phosphodiesterase class I)/ActR/RegA family two-component response regulator